jgi:hypothetical protein
VRFELELALLERCAERRATWRAATLNQKSESPDIAAEASSLPRHQRDERTRWMRLASHPRRAGSTESRGVEAGSAHAYGCTSNAPTSHKQNSDPRSDLKAAVVSGSGGATQ